MGRIEEFTGVAGIAPVTTIGAPSAQVRQRKRNLRKRNRKVESSSIDAFCGLPSITEAVPVWFVQVDGKQEHLDRVLKLAEDKGVSVYGTEHDSWCHLDFVSESEAEEFAEAVKALNLPVKVDVYDQSLDEDADDNDDDGEQTPLPPVSTADDAVPVEESKSPYGENCPVCAKPAVGRCRCSGPHDAAAIVKGHGLKCESGHRWSGDDKRMVIVVETVVPAAPEHATRPAGISETALMLSREAVRTLAEGKAVTIRGVTLEPVDGTAAAPQAAAVTAPSKAQVEAMAASVVQSTGAAVTEAVDLHAAQPAPAAPADAKNVMAAFRMVGGL